MKAKFFISTFIFVCCSILNLSAQIGYQVALLNTATGKPRAGETVNVAIEISDKKSHLIWRETQTVTSNDFGILSLTVGNEKTFKNANWSNLPFFISVSVNDVLIGKTQILSVPLAEAAKGGAPAFPIEDLLGTWRKEDYAITFYEDGTYHYSFGDREKYTKNGYYIVLGNLIFTISKEDEGYDIALFKDKEFCGGYYIGYTK